MCKHWQEGGGGALAHGGQLSVQDMSSPSKQWQGGGRSAPAHGGQLSVQAHV